MLERAGLAIEGAWGRWDGSELSFDSRRLREPTLEDAYVALVGE